MSYRTAERKLSSIAALDAIEVREVDALIAKLLSDLQVSLPQINRPTMTKLADLKTVLATDYCEAPGMPAKPLVGELARVIDNDMRPHIQGISNNLNVEALLRFIEDRFEEIYGPREIEIRAEPYRRGSGLDLRGFFCRTQISEKSKFLIFLNSAHPPAVVAATFGHELGHYIYGSLVSEKSTFNAFIEGSFASHLMEESELFADCLVALAAYDRETLKAIGAIEGPRSDRFRTLLNQVHLLIDKRYNLNPRGTRLATVSRVSYITAMVHFFKLRRAVYKRTGL